MAVVSASQNVSTDDVLRARVEWCRVLADCVRAASMALDASSEPSEGSEFGNPTLVPAKGLMAALATMAADLSSAHRTVPAVGLGDRAAEVVERAVRGRVRAAFHALETKLVRALDELETVASLASESRLGIPSEVGASVKKNTFGAARETAALRETLARVAAVFAGGVAEALADARALLEERPVMVMGWRAEFEGLVRADDWNDDKLRRERELYEGCVQRMALARALGQSTDALALMGVLASNGKT